MVRQNELAIARRKALEKISARSASQRTTTAVFRGIDSDDTTKVLISLDGEDTIATPAPATKLVPGTLVSVILDEAGRPQQVLGPLTDRPEGLDEDAPAPDPVQPWPSLAPREITEEEQQAIRDTETKLDQARTDLDQAMTKADQAVSDATASLIKANAAATGVYQEFAVSASPTTIPSSGWSASTPAWVPGAYIWSRTVTTKGDGTTVTGSPVLTTGNDGPNGANGVAGKDGTGIASTSITYAVSSSGTTAPSSGWQDSPPAAAAGQFMWTRTVLTYTNGSTATLYSTARQGANGAPGQDGAPGSPGTPGTPGVGVASVTPYFLMVTTGANTPAKPTGNPPGGAWSTAEPAYVANTELYRTDRVVYTNSTFAYTDVSKVAAYTAAREAITVANLAAAAAAGMVKASQTDPGHQDGRIWLQLDSQGRTVGIKISDGVAWSSYVLMADQILVPGSVGGISIGHDQISAPHMAAGSVTARTLAVVPETGSGGMILDGQGLDIIPADNDGQSAISLRANAAQWLTFIQDLRATFSVTPDGVVSAQKVMANDELIYRGTELQEILASLPQGIIAHTYLAEDMIFSTAWARACFASFEAVAGRCYKISFTGQFDSTSNRIKIAARQSGGSTVSSGNTIRKSWSVPASRSSFPATMECVYWLDASTTQTMTVGFFLTTNSGNARVLTTGSSIDGTATSEMTVEDCGAAVGVTSVPGYTTVSGSSTGSDSDTAVSTYTKTVSGSWAKNYRINGQATDSLAGYAVQGDIGAGTYAARMSMIGFPSIISDLSGATVKKIEIYVYFAHWYANAGGTAGIGYHGSTSAPSTWVGSAASITQPGIPKPGGVWITLPAATHTSWKSGAYRGLTLRAPSDSTNRVYYGYADPGKCKLRYTYEK